MYFMTLPSLCDGGRSKYCGTTILRLNHAGLKSRLRRSGWYGLLNDGDMVIPCSFVSPVRRNAVVLKVPECRRRFHSFERGHNILRVRSLAGPCACDAHGMPPGAPAEISTQHGQIGGHDEGNV
jgi:hypothetical protein